MKTSELTGPALDWAVAKCKGHTFDDRKKVKEFMNQCLYSSKYCYSTVWAKGGPIIEREGIDIQQVFCSMEGSFAMPCGWKATRHTRGGPINPPYQIADTPLLAAMRCYVASKIGDEIEIPEELLC